MMTLKPIPLNSIEKIINDTLILLQLAEDIPQMSDSTFKVYQATCQKMPGYIREGRLKIAVVGVIKSGKSTFVNSLVGKELVKRGAGVITAITTRIRKGKKNQARIYFKSWDNINFQLQNALQLFPDDGSGNEILADFDIRRENDRKYLKKAYKRLIHDFPDITNEIRPEILMINHALQGFEVCKDLVQADETILCFKSKEFGKHKVYTSDPNMAFYIKDVCLDIFGNVMDPHIEIADCQGADSTDPAQLSQVLTYLESSNLIVYCISSRIGLRQSDVAFLNQIKNLGLLDNVLFINNCDFTEHENLEDLIKIEKSIQDSLEFLEIHPQIFSFSSLYNLFLKRESKLNKKELSRLQFWQEEKKMVQYSDLKTQKFNLLFEQMMDENQHELLISNHLKRLGIILGQLDRRADIFLDLLSSDKKKEETAIETLNNLHHNASRLESIVTNSIQGAVDGLEDEIIFNLNKAFVRDDKDILKNAQINIKRTRIDVEKYKLVTKESGFNQILYLMFQEFKRKLDLYVIEEVNPQLKRFVQTQEKRIISYFQSLFDSYKVDLLKDDQYSQIKAGLKFSDPQSDCIDSVDLDKIKKILGLQLPPKIFDARYTTRIKTGVFTDFGLQSISQIVSTLLNRKSGFSFSPPLKKAAVKIKKENRKIIKGQFEDFHMNLRTTYFLPLIKACTRDFKEKINERFNQYQSFEEEMGSVLSLKQAEKKDQKNKVHAIKKQTQSLSQDIATFSRISRS
ncbi:dynamin family protein [Desulfobacula sp.]